MGKFPYIGNGVTGGLSKRCVCCNHTPFQTFHPLPVTPPQNKDNKTKFYENRQLKRVTGGVLEPVTPRYKNVVLAPDQGGPVTEVKVICPNVPGVNTFISLYFLENVVLPPFFKDNSPLVRLRCNGLLFSTYRHDNFTVRGII